MTNVICNKCGTSQRARIFETSIPFNLANGAELARLFILIIDECAKCKEKKGIALGLNYLGNFINYGYLKQKQFVLAEKKKIRDLEHLPWIRKDPQEGGFYLWYSEYGIVKRCYSNLSTLKLGIDPNLDTDLKRPTLR